MHVDILTLFPPIFTGGFQESILQRAQQMGALSITLHNIRDYAADKHHVTDDIPYGGGGGMVMKPEPIFAAVESILPAEGGPGTTSPVPIILLTPQGRPFTQKIACQLAQCERLVLICGRYEGVDERVREHLVTDEISVGDYVLTGGEIPAMVIVDAVARLLPGVLGDPGAPLEDSHARGLLEYPHYTRPAEFRGWSVPEVLLSGHHARIGRWRREQALKRTWERRPDLLAGAELSEADRQFLGKLKGDRGQLTDDRSRACHADGLKPRRDREEEHSMKLGVLTHYSERILRWVAETGFEVVELSAWPGGPLDATTFSAARKEGLQALMDELGLEISSLGYYPSHLDADGDERARVAGYFQTLLRLAADLGVPVVSTHAAGSVLTTLGGNVAQFVEVFTPHLALAEQLGVKIALENCPQGPGGGNFVNGPESWDAVFEAVDSDFLGIELDPSHLVFRFMDYERAIRDYGPRIFHVHAKDTMIRWDVLGRVGIYGEGWWCFRVPGLGEVDWTRFVDALRLAGYDGAMVIENEDPYFGTGGRDIIYQDPTDLPRASKQAFIYGYHHLRPLMA